MRPEWLRVVAQDDGPAVVYLYGLIGEDWWGDGNAAIDFAKALDELGSRDLELRVNSEGGSVFEGYAMYSALNRYPGKVTAYVDGLAASAASYLILAADEVVMGAASFFMIHNAWAGACFAGNAKEWTEFAADVASRLQMLDKQIVDIYEGHCEKSREDIESAMEATTWLTAEQTVEWGFASRIDEGLKAAACISPEAAKMFGSVPDGIDIGDKAPTVTANTEPVDMVEGPEQELVVEQAQERQPMTIGEVMSLSYRTSSRKEEPDA